MRKVNPSQLLWSTSWVVGSDGARNWKRTGPEVKSHANERVNGTRMGSSGRYRVVARYRIEYARPEEGESCDEMRSMAEIRYKTHGQYYKKINYKPNEAIDDLH